MAAWISYTAQKFLKRNLPSTQIIRLRLLIRTTKPDKDLLAQQIIDHAAHPHYIGQGDHNTCNVTALESRLFSTEPSKASQLIADVATTGQYTAKDGSTVTLDQKDLAKDSNSQANLSANGDGDRSYASQLFQTTALDLHFQTEGKRYRDIPGGNTPSDRNAYGLPDKEEVIDSHGRHKPFTGLNLPAISQIAGKITGENEQGHFWQNANEVDKTQDNRSTTVFKSEVDFEDKLKSHNKTDDYPVVLFVDSSKAPFDDRASLNAGGSGAWHVVTVTGYNEKEREVSYANEHSLSENHLGSEGVPLYVLYQATQKAKTE